MPDDVTAAPAEQDQPTTPEAPETDQPTSETESFTDFDPTTIPEDADREWLAKRYSELQSGWTQKTQGLAQERQEAQELREFAEAMQDPATRDQILKEHWGYEFEDEEPNEEYLDPEDELRARLEAVEGTLTQQQQEYVQEQQSSQAMDEIAEGIEALENSWGDGFEFKGKTLKAVQAYAEVHGPKAIPEIGEAMREIAEDSKQQWVESKKSPRRISQGTPGQKTVIPKDRDERLALAVEAMEEADASA